MGHADARRLVAGALVTAMTVLAAGCGQGGGSDTGAVAPPAAQHDRAVTGSPARQAADLAEPELAAAAARELGSRLKSRLVATLQSEGPVAAIDVCQVEAPEIAADVSAGAGLQVGRRSLKLRNPANRPDTRERAVLEGWQAAVAAGTAATALPVHTEAGADFLWMKPIVVEGPCLTCHGEVLAEPVAAAIAARYPDDQATGYALGDLRGAFVVRAF